MQIFEDQRVNLSHTFYSAKDFFSPNFQFLLGIEKNFKMRRIGHLQPVAKKHGLIELPLCKPAAPILHFKWKLLILEFTAKKYVNCCSQSAQA